MWLFALASAGLAATDQARVTPRLGLIDAPQLVPESAWWFGPYLMVAVGAVLGLCVAATAGWRGAPWAGIALSGLAGPALVASAYLITGWGVSGNGEDIAPYVASLVAAFVGLIVSAAIAVPRRRLPRPVVVVAEPAALTGTDTLAIAPRATAPAPLAIASYAEPTYRRDEPAFYPKPPYLPPRPAEVFAAREVYDERLHDDSAYPAPAPVYVEAEPAERVYEPVHFEPVVAQTVYPRPVDREPVHTEPVYATPLDERRSRRGGRRGAPGRVPPRSCPEPQGPQEQGHGRARGQAPAQGRAGPHRLDHQPGTHTGGSRAQQGGLVEGMPAA